MRAPPADLSEERSPQLGGRGRGIRLLVVGSVAVAVLVVALVGRLLTAWGTDLHLAGGSVLVGPVQVVLTARVLLPLAVAAAGVAWAPALATRLRWPVLLAGAAAASGLFAVTVAWSSGWARPAEPMLSRHEYLHDVGRVGGIGTFLSTFTESVPIDAAQPWTTHVSGHPPGALLAFVLLDRAGLGGAGWAAALCVAGGAAAVPAVLVTVRAVAEERAARVMAPFAVFIPAVVWMATSADALFAGVAAWGIAGLATAAARGVSPAGYACALAGGSLLGLSLFLSFGLASAGLLALAVVLVRRARLGRNGVLGLLAVGAVGVLAVGVAFAAGGYSWFDGLGVAAQRVRDGAAYADRPYAYFLAANVAAAAVAAGPAVVAGLAGLRPRGLAWLPLAALGGMAVSDLSGLVLGETERIWLPFLVWLLPATATLPARSHRYWLASSALLAVAVEVTVRTPW